jgi:sigma-B regulation protein RsbU (phosphoserine phosphatase)
MLFIYTDGLTEAENSRQHLFGASNMRLILERNFDDPRQLIENMERSVHEFVGNIEQSDDLTMLALRYNGKCSASIFQSSLTLACDTSQTERLGEWMEMVCEQAGFDAATSTKLNIAVEEAVVNVMNYAYPADSPGEVRIDASVADGKLVLTISDWGQPFDPTAVEPVDTSLDADDRPIGGLGIHLIRRYTDSLSYERRDDMNVLTMVKRLNCG